MKRRIGIVAIAVTIFAWGCGALAQVVTLNYVTAATGEDFGPQDGIFDAFTVLNFGSVNNNGYTSFRTAVEFALPVMPQGAKIRSAVVNGDIYNFEGSRQIAIYGYAGDGTIQLADFALGVPLASTTIGPQGTNPFTFDVTSLVSTLAGSGQRYVGLNLREEPANPSNFTVMFLSMGILPNLTVVMAAPPTIATAFGSSTIPLAGSTSLTFTIANSNASVAQTGITFTDSLPVGLVVAPTPNLSNTCSGTAIALSGTSSVSLTGGTLPPGAGCAISVVVQGVAAGVKNNSVTVASAEDGAGNTSNASITVVAPPTIGKSFGAADIPLDGNTTLTFNINNPNATSSLTGIGFIDTLPPGLAVATPNGVSGTCGGGTITAIAGSGAIRLTSATLAANVACTFSVSVTGTTPGTQNNFTGAVSSVEGGTGATTSATLAVVAPPTIAKAFSPTSITQDTVTRLTFTLANPSGNTTALAGVAFSDALPTGTLVAAPSGLSGSCGGGTIAAVPYSGSVMLSGATLPIGVSCTFSVNVTGSAIGSYTNTTGNVSASNAGTGGAASARLNVVATIIPTLSKWGLVALSVLTTLVAFFVLRRRQQGVV